MVTIESLYRLFNIPPTCSDDELKHAYFHALLKHHPDKNLDDIDAATVKTQELTVAYANLKKFRANREHSENNWQTIIIDQEFTIEFSFGGIDLDGITERKSAFGKAWLRFKENSSDPVSALHLIHSAFRAQRSDSIKELLLNPILIDSATVLLSFVDKDSVGDTYLKWAEFLRINLHSKEAIQLLEDIFAAGLKWSAIADVLRNLHYALAQYVDPATGLKATPEVRIEHLNRIVDLGFKYDYIYKFLAEAYYELGNIEQASVYLKQAYEINPELLGAVKISRALGFSQANPSSNNKPFSNKKPLDKYKWIHPEQIPPTTLIHEWVKTENWSALIEFADPNQYLPRILPKVRKELNQIADSLGKYSDPKSIEALINLINSIQYWDVKVTAISSLSKIGDNSVYSFLQQQTPTNMAGKMHLIICLSYLKTRLDKNILTKLTTTSHSDLFSQAEYFYKNEDYGRARVILEYLLEHTESTYASYFKIKFLLARSCAKMMWDPSTSIELIEPIFYKLPKGMRDDIALDLASWIYQNLQSQGYCAIKDEQYQCGLGILLERSLVATNPNIILENLHITTRWLETLGIGDLNKWIRQLVRFEVPGTWYEDDRENYVENVELSQGMRNFFLDTENQLKSKVAPKLRGMIESTLPLDDINPINDGN